jgi:hypothetical protein
VLQRNVVVLIQVVEADDLVAAIEQELGRMEANEARSARD